MNHRPASTNRQNSRDGSGAPAKALLSFKGAGYYSHAGEAKREARQPLDPDRRRVRRRARLRQRSGRSERSDDDGAAVRQWRPPAPQRRGLPGDGQRDPAEAAPHRGAITRRDRITRPARGEPLSCPRAGVVVSRVEAGNGTCAGCAGGAAVSPAPSRVRVAGTAGSLYKRRLTLGRQRIVSAWQPRSEAATLRSTRSCAPPRAYVADDLRGSDRPGSVTSPNCEGRARGGLWNLR